MARAKYDYNDPDFLAEIEGLARDGWNNVQIAKKFRLGESHFSHLLTKHEQLLQALKRGRKPLDIVVENSLYKRAVGLKTRTITRQWIEDEDGNTMGEQKITEVVTEYPPDTGAACAWLKQRKPEIWNKQPIKIDHTSSDGSMTPKVNISPIEWTKTTDAKDK